MWNSTGDGSSIDSLHGGCVVKFIRRCVMLAQFLSAGEGSRPTALLRGHLQQCTCPCQRIDRDVTCLAPPPPPVMGAEVREIGISSWAGGSIEPPKLERGRGGSGPGRPHGAKLTRSIAGRKKRALEKSPQREAVR